MTFEDFLLEHGYEPDFPLDDSGRVRRFRAPDEKRGRKSAWYWYVGEAGVVGDWRNGEKLHWFDKDKLRDNHQERRKDRIAELHEKSVAKWTREQKEQNAAAEMARKVWDEATIDAYNHPYLETKMIQPNGARLHKNGRALLVPLYNLKNDLVNLQRIYPDGSKRFLKGGEVMGVAYHIGGVGRPYICEGFATGATIHQVTGASVYCAMNCTNMQDVAIQLRKDSPIIAADNDYLTRVGGKLVNPGLNMGMHISKVMRMDLVFPAHMVEEGCAPVIDFNDLMQTAGEKETRRQLKAKVRLG